MTDTTSTETASLAPSLDAAHDELVTRVAQARRGDGELATLTHVPSDRAELLQRIEQAREAGGALLWRGADPELATAPEVVELLAEIAAAAPVIVELLESDASPPRRRPHDLAGIAAELAAALRGAAVLEARSLEVALLTFAGERAPAPIDGATIKARLVVAGTAEDRLRRAIAGAAIAAPGAGAPYVNALFEANLELRRANARLAREQLGHLDSAAATVLNRYESDIRHVQSRFDELQAAHDGLLARHAELGRRMRMPHHRFVNKLAMALLRIPGLGPLSRAAARRRAR